ncbi:MAG: outer membrane lipoprotein carrier protein LolA [Desulfobacterales bacterium]
MTLRKWNIVLFGLIILFPYMTYGQESSDRLNSEKGLPSLTLDEVIAKVEERYRGANFSARFYQASTLKAVEITDTAKGRVYIKYPGMMRWEYETPEKQIILTDGMRLWVYRPEENQVTVGKAPSFFGEGKGASFLSDIKRVRKYFDAVMEKRDRNKNYVLKLLPKKEMAGVSEIYLTVNRNRFEVVRIITRNIYHDETRIDLTGLKFEQKLDAALFRFDIPDGVDVLRFDEPNR